MGKKFAVIECADSSRVILQPMETVDISTFERPFDDEEGGPHSPLFSDVDDVPPLLRTISP